MARKIDTKSKRQKVFAYLDTQTHRLRADVLADIMQTFDMKSKSYANTLYQCHRKMSKSSGGLVEVFSIRDHKEGLTVDPYVFSKHVAPVKVTTSDATSIPVAVEFYKVELIDRASKAHKIPKK